MISVILLPFTALLLTAIYFFRHYRELRLARDQVYRSALLDLPRQIDELRRQAGELRQKLASDSPASGAKPDNHGAFTLVEMLVTVAILGLLASFLFPALSQAKSQARLIQCKSNLGQIGKALIMYEGEAGLYPGAGLPIQEINRLKRKRTDDSWDMRLFPLVANSSDVFSCPSFNPRSEGGIKVDAYGYNAWGSCSIHDFSQNLGLGSGMTNTEHRYVRSSDIRSTADMVAVGDLQMPPGLWINTITRHWGHISTFDNSVAPDQDAAVARPLRIELPGARYHVTARGNERRAIFRDDRDRQRFVELLAVLPERFGTRLHAYVLMPNHYHLLLETPEGNLSRAGQWLNVSYSVGFNRRHGRSGHLFQGRFAAVILEDDAGVQEVGRYVHLNPVRVAGLGSDKGQRAADRIGAGGAPSEALIGQRLRVLRAWKWGSYRAYAGYAPAPPWLCREVLGRLCGGRGEKERQEALRNYTEQAVRQGLPERPWERLIGGVVLGTAAFAQRLQKGLRADTREQRGAGKLRGGVKWEHIVQAVEREKGERWAAFLDRHGDWGRDAALWLGRRLGRLSLRELAVRAGGLDYAAVGAAVSRFPRRVAEDTHLAKSVRRMETELSNVEM